MRMGFGRHQLTTGALTTHQARIKKRSGPQALDRKEIGHL
jgi:hypothetical protein